jgi:styrene monooxygenase A-like protein
LANVGIVGAGISGLHLALFLLEHGVETTLYTHASAAEMRTGRLQNNVCRFGRTRERERQLGVDHWNVPDFAMTCAHVRVHVDPPIAFRGDLKASASFVDFRIYLPRLLEDYAARGGRVVKLESSIAAVNGIANSHDLVVIAAGGRALPGLFPRDHDRSAAEPARLLLAGLFHGVEHTVPVGLHFDIVPGAGEIFQSPVLTFAGRVTGITFEAIPGGPWDGLVRRRWYDEPGGCERAVLRLLADSDSEILGRVDRSGFALTRSLDLLQGAITPTVRRPWVLLDEGRYAVAVGDAAVLNDPVTGQGANLGSAAAWALGEAILAATAFDERFCASWEVRLGALARSVTEWTSAALAPPPDHAVRLLRTAADDQAVANAFMDNFDDPDRMWASLASAEGASAFVEEARTRPAVAQASTTA